MDKILDAKISFQFHIRFKIYNCMFANIGEDRSYQVCGTPNADIASICHSMYKYNVPIGI